MSTPVDVPQNLHIHLAPPEKVVQMTKSEPARNNRHESQDFMGKSEKKQAVFLDEELEKKKKNHKQASTPQDEEESREQDAPQPVDESDLGRHLDLTI